MSHDQDIKILVNLKKNYSKTLSFDCTIDSTMFQQYYEPHPALKGFVNNIIIDHVQFAAKQPHLAFTIPPLPEHCLMFYLRDASTAKDVTANNCETLAGAIIIGPNTSRHTITPGKDHLMIKVGFQPGGLYRLLGIPMTALLCGDTFHAADLLGNSIHTLVTQLQETVCYSNMKTLIEHYLMTFVDKLKQLLPIDSVLPVVIRAGGLVIDSALDNTSVIEDELGNSRIKNFTRLFH